MSTAHESAQGVPPPDEASVDRREWLGLVILTLVAFALRMVMLGRAALWQDEIAFVVDHTGIDTNPVAAFMRHWDAVIITGHMPLVGSLHNAYLHLLGFIGFTDAIHSPWINRLPMAVAGTLMVPGVYLAARSIFGRGHVAWCVALLTACSFYPVYYSREAYHYPAILCFGSWGLAGWVRVYRHGGVGNFILATLGFTGMALSHLGAVIAVAGMAGVAGLLWFTALLHQSAAPEPRRRFLALLAPTVAFLAASPFLLRFMLFNTLHIGKSSPPPLWIVLNDVVNKMFLGEQPMLAVSAWLVFAAGLTALVMAGRHDRRNAGPMVAGALLAGLVLLGVATTRSQYISARYFSPLSPSMYIAFGAGLSAIGGTVATLLSSRGARAVGPAALGLTACCLVPHVCFFLPLYWVVPDRQEPFERAAKWMNDNLASGTPYVVELPYQHRWLGQFHPTPNLVPLVPCMYDGYAPKDMLYAKQAELLNRIPEAAYVQLCGIIGTASDPPWEWPAAHFRNRVSMDNVELRRVIRSGIFPSIPYEYVDDWDYNIDIFFNHRSDRVAMAREQGCGVLFDFPNWAFAGQPVSAQEVLYFRIPKDARRTFTIENVTDHAVAGAITIEFLVVGPPRQVSSVTFMLGDIEAKADSVEHGKLTTVSLEVPALGPGVSEIQISLPSGDATARNVAVWDVRWSPRTASELPSAADASLLPKP